MPKDNRSFFEKLTGAPPEGSFEPEEPEIVAAGNVTVERDTDESALGDHDTASEWLQEVEGDEGQLTVDVYQTPSHIVIQAPMAGVKPDDVDVSITQDMITIKGKRENRREAGGSDYYYQELYWGSFSRSILLPQEVDVDHSEASFKNGLLVIKLPKIDKNRPKSVHIHTRDE